MKLKGSLFIAITVVLVITLTIQLRTFLKFLDYRRTFYATVTAISGNLLKLSNNDKVLLAGVYIPQRGETNYLPSLENNIKELILRKSLKFKKVLSKNIRYPEYDLVNIYDSSGTCINAALLSSGQAFFDQGFYPGKNVYEKLEQQAKKQNLGLWKNQNLKILYSTSRLWWDFHYPECPEVKKIKAKDRIDYYFFPTPIFSYRDPAECNYCKEIEIKYNRPKLFTYTEKDYLEDVRKEKEAAKNKTRQ